MDNHLAEKLRHLFCQKKNKIHAIFPSCAIYVDDKKMISFDFDIERDVELLKKFSKEYSITIRVLIEFDALREYPRLRDKSKFLVKFENGKIEYGKGYVELMTMLERRRKKK